GPGKVLSCDHQLPGGALPWGWVVVLGRWPLILYGRAPAPTLGIELAVTSCPAARCHGAD
ncbi:hypothetical protein, partial [Shewanella chilikensis]|uniref:hypothetical protein n=1 Tax=Shewanella TaxID=22 RepID=UPI003999EDCE